MLTTPVLLLGLISSAATPAPDEEATRTQAEAAIKQFEQFYANKNQHVRKAAVMGLADCNHELAVEPLIGAIADESTLVRDQVPLALARQSTSKAFVAMLRTLKTTRKVDIQLALLEAFKVTRPPLVYDTVLKLAAKGAFETKIVTAELLGLLPQKGSRSEEALLALLDDKSPQIRLAAIDSLGQLGSASLADTCMRILVEDDDWRVRASCVDALAEFRLKETIPPLISAMESEEGRLQDDIHDALVQITGELDQTADPQSWQKWWDRVGDRWEVPSKEEVERRRKQRNAGDRQYAPALRKYTPFVGIETRSRRMLFLLDISGSMADQLSMVGADAARIKAFKEQFGDYEHKIELAREHLINTIATLPSYVKFNIITFHTDVKHWKKGLVAANTGNKNNAIRFLARLTPSELRNLSNSTQEAGRTNTFDVLNAAFRLTKKPTARPTKNHTVEADTAFLVTDGLPTAGRLTDPDELLRYFMTINRRTKMVFHCITFGYGNESLLKPIAETSSGQYLVITLE